MYILVQTGHSHVHAGISVESKIHIKPWVSTHTLLEDAETEREKKNID